MRMQDGELVWDDEYADKYWPDFDVDSWVKISSIPNDNNNYFANLVLDSTFTNKTINVTDVVPDNNNVIATMEWKENIHVDSPHGVILKLDVDENYRGSGVGFFFAGSIRSWFHMNRGMLLKEPPPGFPFRSDQLEPMIKRWSVELQDNSMLFYEPLDGQYYHYDDWVAKYG